MKTSCCYLLLLLLLACWAAGLVDAYPPTTTVVDDAPEEDTDPTDGFCGTSSLKPFEAEVEARDAVWSSWSCTQSSKLNTTTGTMVDSPASCTFLCKQGYRPTAEEGAVRTQCSDATPTGQWLNLTGRCEPKYACKVSQLPQLDPDTRGWSWLSGGLTTNGTFAVQDATFNARCSNFRNPPQFRTAVCTVSTSANQTETAAWELSPNTCARMSAVTCGAPPVLSNVVWPASCTGASFDTNCIGACAAGTVKIGGGQLSTSCLISGAWSPIIGITAIRCEAPGNFTYLGCFTDESCAASLDPNTSYSQPSLTGPMLSSTSSVASCLVASQGSLAGAAVLGVRTGLSGFGECYFGSSIAQLALPYYLPTTYNITSGAALNGTNFTEVAASECSRPCPDDGLPCGFNSTSPSINTTCTFALYTVAQDNTTNNRRRLASASDSVSFTTAELIDGSTAPTPQAEALPHWPEVEDDGHRHTMRVPRLRAQIVVDSKPLHVLGMLVLDAHVEGGVPRLIECLNGGSFVALASANVAPVTSAAAGADQAAAWLRHAASAALAGLDAALSSAGALYVSPMQSTGGSNRAQQMLSIKSVMQQNYARLFRVPECVSAPYSLWHYMMHQFEVAGGSDTMSAAAGASLLNKLQLDLKIGAVGRPDGQPAASNNNADADCQAALVGSRVRVQLYSSLHGIFRASDVARDVSLWAFAAGPAGDGACMEVAALSAAR